MHNTIRIAIFIHTSQLWLDAHALGLKFDSYMDGCIDDNGNKLMYLKDTEENINCFKEITQAKEKQND